MLVAFPFDKFCTKYMNYMVTSRNDVYIHICKSLGARIAHNVDRIANKGINDLKKCLI